MNSSNNNVKDSLEKKKFEKNTFQNMLLRYGILLFTFALMVFFSFFAPRFFTARNFFNLISSAAITGIFALALTNTVCMANFEIAFASVGIFGGVIYIVMLGNGISLYNAMFLTLIVCVVIYFLFALCLLYIKIPSFIASIALLGTMTGITNWITKGGMIYSNVPGFEKLGRHMYFDIIPSPMLVFIVVSLVIVYIVEYTYFGRYMYLIGSNESAAKYAGIDTTKTKFIGLLMSGVLVGIGGLVTASRFGSCGPTIISGYTFPAIIVMFIGSIFFKAGTPNPLGTFLAAILIALIENGLVLMDVDIAFREMIRGILLFVAVGMVSSMKEGGIPELEM